MSDLSPIETQAAPKIIPHSREAEEAVLGAVMINPETYYEHSQPHLFEIVITISLFLGSLTLMFFRLFSCAPMIFTSTGTSGSGILSCA